MHGCLSGQSDMKDDVGAGAADKLWQTSEMWRERE